MCASDWENEGLCALVLHLASVTGDDPPVAIALNIGDSDVDLQLPPGDWQLSLSSAGEGNVEVLPRRAIMLFEGLLA